MRCLPGTAIRTFHHPEESTWYLHFYWTPCNPRKLLPLLSFWKEEWYFRSLLIRRGYLSLLQQNIVGRQFLEGSLHQNRATNKKAVRYLPKYRNGRSPLTTSFKRFNILTDLGSWDQTWRLEGIIIIPFDLVLCRWSMTFSGVGMIGRRSGLFVTGG